MAVLSHQILMCTGPTSIHKDGDWKIPNDYSGSTGKYICSTQQIALLTMHCREFDPWKTSGMSSEFRPGGPLENTKKHPVQVIPGGFHCSDLRLKNAEHNEGVQKVVDTVVAQIVEWVSEYPNK